MGCGSSNQDENEGYRFKYCANFTSYTTKMSLLDQKLYWEYTCKNNKRATSPICSECRIFSEYCKCKRAEIFRTISNPEIDELRRMKNTFCDNCKTNMIMCSCKRVKKPKAKGKTRGGVKGKVKRENKKIKVNGKGKENSTKGKKKL